MNTGMRNVFQFAWVAAGFAGYCAALLVLSDFWVFIINQCVVGAIGALGLNLLTGYAGQVSVGNAAFIAIGGFTSVAVMPYAGIAGALLTGAAACGVVGFLVGLPALRLRGIYLAISTLALQYIVVFVFHKIQDGQEAYSGYNIAAPSIGPIVIDSDGKWGVVLAIALAVSIYIVWCLVNSRPGRAWAAVREHDIAAAMTGVDVRKYKLLAFIISSMMIGAAGVLRTLYNGHIGYEEFTLEMTVSYVAMIIVGGMASISGSILGAFLVVGLPYVVQHLATNTFPSSWSGFLWSNLSLLNITLYGVIVLAFLMFEPRGLAALLSRGYRRVVRRREAPAIASAEKTP